MTIVPGRILESGNSNYEVRLIHPKASPAGGDCGWFLAVLTISDPKEETKNAKA
jgi:hypothetical protein